MATVLGDERAAQGAEDAPGPARIPPAVRPVAPFPPGSGTDRSRPGAHRALPRLLAGVAAAFAVMWATAAPSGEPTSVRTVGGASAPSGWAPWATTTTAPAATADGSAPAGGPAPVEPSGPPTLAAGPTSGQAARPGPGATSGALPAPGPLERSGTPPAAARPDPGPDPAGDRAGPGPAPRPPSPGAPPDPSLRPCPGGAPEAVVSERRALPGATRGLLDGVEPEVEPEVEVRGTITNPSDDDLVVRSYEIVVDDGDAEVRVPGSPAPLAVPAGGAGHWRVTVPGSPDVDTSPVVEVRLLDWAWSDPAIDARCPS